MYTVYKIVNKINGKYYIGVHKTDDPMDSYFGSGKAIKQAIEKYGIENFTKEILHITEDKTDAYNLENKLTEDYITNKTYNQKQGGIGGFSKENAWKGFIAKSRKGGNSAVKKGYGFGGHNQKDPKECGRKGGLNNKGKPKSEEHKKALRESWRIKKLQTSSNG